MEIVKWHLHCNFYQSDESLDPSAFQANEFFFGRSLFYCVIVLAVIFFFELHHYYQQKLKKEIFWQPADKTSKTRRNKSIIKE